MPAHPATSNLAATTIENITDFLADNVTIGKPFTERMNRMGRIKTRSGGIDLIEPIKTGKVAGVEKYTGRLETLTLTNPTFTTTAKFPWAYFWGHIVMTTEEKNANQAPEAFIDLMGAKTEQALDELKEHLEVRMLGKFNATDAAETIGISHLLDPASGGAKTIGGITTNTSDSDSSNWVNGYWDVKHVDKASTAYAREHFDEIFSEISQGNTRRPTLILSTYNKFIAEKKARYTYERYPHVNGGSLSAFATGAEHLMIDDIPWIWSDVDAAEDASFGDDRIYIINEQTLCYAKSSNTWMNNTGWRTRDAGTADYTIFECAGNLTINERRVNGVLEYDPPA